MKKILLFAALMLAIFANAQTPKVYFTKEISPEALVEMFKTLGVEPVGNVCVKISTGEGGNTHYLKPELIGELVKTVDGTHITPYAESIGLGSTKYELVNIDEK